MSRKPLIWLFGLIALPLIMCRGYWWLSDHPPFPMAAVSLSANLFPAGVAYDHMLPPGEGGPGLQTGMQTFYWSGRNGIAVYIIDRYLTRRGAEQAFQFHVNSYVGRDPSQVERLYPHRFDHTLNADRHFAGCGIRRFVGFGCVYVATYERYFVYFGVKIDEDMRVERFDRIVLAIDDLFLAAFRSAR